MLLQPHRRHEGLTSTGMHTRTLIFFLCTYYNALFLCSSSRAIFISFAFIFFPYFSLTSYSLRRRKEMGDNLNARRFSLSELLARAAQSMTEIEKRKSVEDFCDERGVDDVVQKLCCAFLRVTPATAEQFLEKLQHKCKKREVEDDLQDFIRQFITQSVSER